MSDTPRTDLAIKCIGPTGKALVEADFARQLERETAALREALSEAIAKRAETREWRTDHPTTTGKPERWVRDESCTKWRAALDAARKEAQP